jgi:hypothetical protein
MAYLRAMLRHYLYRIAAITIAEIMLQPCTRRGKAHKIAIIKTLSTLVAYLVKISFL